MLEESNEQRPIVKSESIITDQVSLVFSLVNVADALLEELQSADLGSARFLEYGLTELSWLQQKVTHIDIEVDYFLEKQKNHPLKRTIVTNISRSRQQIENARQTLSQAALDSIEKPENCFQHRIDLKTDVYILSLSLNQMYHYLRALII